MTALGSYMELSPTTNHARPAHVWQVLLQHSSPSGNLSAAPLEYENPNSPLQDFLGFSTTIPAAIAKQVSAASAPLTVGMQLSLSVTMETSSI